MMAREIKLAKIADYIEGQVEQLLRATVLTTDEKLKTASPVDTGQVPRELAGWGKYKQQHTSTARRLQGNTGTT